MMTMMIYLSMPMEKRKNYDNDDISVDSNGKEENLSTLVYY